MNLIPLEDLAATATGFMAGAKASNTLRAYQSDWNHYEAWCLANGLEDLPAAPQTVALYVTAFADELKVSTLQRRITAISEAHRRRGHELNTKHPALRDTWSGIKRAKGTAAEGVTPVLAADITAMVSALPDSLLGVRDRALLLIGFAGAFRRSELSAMEVGDLGFTDEGVVITLRRSKTDQEGQGRKVAIPHGSSPRTCPVKALRAWLDVLDDEGKVFRSITRHGVINGSLTDKSVARIVKRSAETAGLDPATVSGHSLRSGFATSAASAGASERAIAKQTGHKSLQVLRGYIRDGNLFRENAATMVGL